MQQYTVPQFIDVEDKIIGPITTRQFLIFLVATIVIAISYKIFDFSLFITVTIAIAFISFLFAFLKVNGRPFHFFVLNVIQTLKRSPLRVWLMSDTPESIFEEEEIEKVEKIATKSINLKSSRLDQLSLIVDTSGQYKGDDLIKLKDKTNKNGAK